MTNGPGVAAENKLKFIECFEYIDSIFASDI